MTLSSYSGDQRFGCRTEEATTMNIWESLRHAKGRQEDDEEGAPRQAVVAPLQARLAETRLALRVGAALLLANVGVAILIGILSLLVTRDKTVGQLSLLSMAIDLVIGINLWCGRTQWRAWAVLRAVLGFIFWGLAALARGSYLNLAIQAAISGALILVLAGEGRRWRTLSAVGLFSAGLIVLGWTSSLTIAVSVFNEQGQKLYQEGKLDQAVEKFETAIRLDPQSVETYRNLGGVYYHQGNLDKARENYQTAIRLNPNLADSHRSLGWVYYGRDEPYLALKEFREAIRLDPNSADAYDGMGWLYYHQEEMDQAEKQFQTALDLDPDSADARVGLGWSYYYRDKLDLALFNFELAARRDPRMASAYCGQGWVYYRQGKLDRAATAF
jgi:Tfp pilus assembly protein PilF